MSKPKEFHSGGGILLRIHPHGVEVERDLNAMQTETICMISWAHIEAVLAAKPKGDAR
jgi:hypothetical protein